MVDNSTVHPIIPAFSEVVFCGGVKTYYVNAAVRLVPNVGFQLVGFDLYRRGERVK